MHQTILIAEGNTQSSLDPIIIFIHVLKNTFSQIVVNNVCMNRQIFSQVLYNDFEIQIIPGSISGTLQTQYKCMHATNFKVRKIKY